MRGVEAQGVILAAHRGEKYDVQIGEHIASCYLCGKMHKNHIHVVPGDSVAVELSVYDLTKGRIITRL